MPKIRTKRGRKPPQGFDDVKPQLDDFGKRMRDAEHNEHEGKRRVEGGWEIIKIDHQRTRYVYELFYKRRQISRDLYEYLLKESYANAGLIAKWKKSGYEKLCCLRCIQSEASSFGTTCICRVPKSEMDKNDDGFFECQNCGCRGCASTD